MGIGPCSDKNNGLKRGSWTPEEDLKLVDYIQRHGCGNWRILSKNAGLRRCGKSCRLRWNNYLRPDIKRGRFSYEEEEAIIHLHSILGNKWSAIAASLPGRTDNEIKNHWNTHIKKRLLRMGIDPVTHSTRPEFINSFTILGNSTLYNAQSTSSQMNMSEFQGVQPMVNPTSLPSQEGEIASSYLMHDFQEIEHQNSSSSLMQNVLMNTTQIQTPIHDHITSYTTMSNTTTTATDTTTSSAPYIPLLDEAQLMEPNFEDYPTNISNLDAQSSDHWPSLSCYDIPDQTSMNLALSDSSISQLNFSGLQNFMSYAVHL